MSTNPITQGEQASPLWKPLVERYHVRIDFAYRTFRWDSEAASKAHVHCVIIGFSDKCSKEQEKAIYESERKLVVQHINPYLVPANDVFIVRRSHPIGDCEEMLTGSEPRDGGFLLMSKDERDSVLKKYAELNNYILRFITGEDFINDNYRYCLWLKDADPAILVNNSFIVERLKRCRDFRLRSKQQQARKMADFPSLFVSERQPATKYLLIPQASSENRRYIPIGYMNPDVIVSNTCFTVANASPYTFGVLTSNVHMAWMRAVCGRLKSDYRYSNMIVYNNFPWPTPSDKQRSIIEKTALSILDMRSKYSGSNYATLYNELAMPPDLRKAHQQNDRAVMQAYGFSVKDMTESKCVAELMRMYQRLVEDA